MKVVCISNEGFMLSRNSVKEGYDRKTTYRALAIKKNYDIYGMILYDGGMRYLIYDDYENPMWYPAELFEIEDSKLPNFWHYKYYGYDGYNVAAIWGYDELVNSEEHYDGIVEREKEDIELFMKKFGEQIKTDCIRKKIKNNQLEEWKNNFEDKIYKVSDTERYIDDERYDIFYDINDLDNITFYKKKSAK